MRNIGPRVDLGLRHFIGNLRILLFQLVFTAVYIIDESALADGHLLGVHLPMLVILYALVLIDLAVHS